MDRTIISANKEISKIGPETPKRTRDEPQRTEWYSNSVPTLQPLMMVSSAPAFWQGRLIRPGLVTFGGCPPCGNDGAMPLQQPSSGEMGTHVWNQLIVSNGHWRSVQLSKADTIEAIFGAPKTRGLKFEARRLKTGCIVIEVRVHYKLLTSRQVNR